MDYLPVRPLPAAPRQQNTTNPHSRHFHQFRHPLFIKHPAAITHIHFCPTKPHRYAVSSSTRVLVYAPKTGKVIKTISRFKDTARGGEFRKDGKLVVAGGDDGVVQVFDVNSRAVLRTMKEHNQPVRVTHFSPHLPQLLSASDDTTVKLWDLSTQECLTTLSSHTDYVRSAVFSPTDPSLILSGSYDSTIRLHDVRLPADEANVITMRHGGAPVEDVLAFPSGGVALSVGGPILRVWDLAMAGKCVRALSNHQKTVTSVAFDGTKGRVLTGGLDNMVKVYDVEDWKVVHTMRYPAPILSLAVSPDDTHIAAGMTDGTLSVRRRDPKASELSTETVQNTAIKNGAYEYFADMEGIFGLGHIKKKGKDMGPVVGPADEFRVESKRQKRLRDFDKHLKNFKYGAALDAALNKNSKPTTTFALISELIQRDALRISLAGRDDVTLEPLLNFLARNITDPRFGELAAEVAGVIIDIYTPLLGRSPVLDEMLSKIQARVERELKFQGELMKLRGALDMTLAQSVMGRVAGEA
ncbi:U3 small nucleolar RNA-associated protein 15 [Cryptococcus wingfieldii CBS 7118]|uniref:U3 small nucleolar RNA-associated protein 15 n=1 Tax=Cryptococcus wingfieldii CBS 7118 TaxID=1295528 RepID=A0A1E3JHM6_9TREE|nr:U3 small nucleolar RNA-associated protein 15 [Cryptococcus wingfieldii CBS 7118]ODN99421.1 U3 small nucleolar RNA-associated protein 15 [Cryptococcus wingfieldii CBS 7118]